jgi:hypothetical protein
MSTEGSLYIGAGRTLKSGSLIEFIRGTGYDPVEDIRNGIFEISTFIDVRTAKPLLQMVSTTV